MNILYKIFIYIKMTTTITYKDSGNIYCTKDGYFTKEELLLLFKSSKKDFNVKSQCNDKDETRLQFTIKKKIHLY